MWIFRVYSAELIEDHGGTGLRKRVTRVLCNFSTYFSGMFSADISISATAADLMLPFLSVPYGPLAEQLGHHYIQITVDTYGHLIPGANLKAVNAPDDPEWDTEAVHKPNVIEISQITAIPAPQSIR